MGRPSDVASPHGPSGVSPRIRFLRTSRSHLA